MKNRMLVKSCLPSIAVVILVLIFSVVAGKNDLQISDDLFVLRVLFGKDFLTFLVIVALSLGFEVALWFIYKGKDGQKLRFLLTPVAVLLAALVVGIVLLFNAPWIDLAILRNFSAILLRICILVIPATGLLWKGMKA